MSGYLPSEIARLVLGYLKEEGCAKSYNMFLKECIHLQEYNFMLKKGREYPTKIAGKTLLEMLDLYYMISVMLDRETNKDELSSRWIKFDDIVCELKILSTTKTAVSTQRQLLTNTSSSDHNSRIASLPASPVSSHVEIVYSSTSANNELSSQCTISSCVRSPVPAVNHKRTPESQSVLQQPCCTNDTSGNHQQNIINKTPEILSSKSRITDQRNSVSLPDPRELKTLISTSNKPGSCTSTPLPSVHVKQTGQTLICSPCVSASTTDNSDTPCVQGKPPSLNLHKSVNDTTIPETPGRGIVFPGSESLIEAREGDNSTVFATPCSSFSSTRLSAQGDISDKGSTSPSQARSIFPTMASVTTNSSKEICRSWDSANTHLGCNISTDTVPLFSSTQQSTSAHQSIASDISNSTDIISSDIEMKEISLHSGEITLLNSNSLTAQSEKGNLIKENAHIECLNEIEDSASVVDGKATSEFISEEHTSTCEPIAASDEQPNIVISDVSPEKPQSIQWHNENTMSSPLKMLSFSSLSTPGKRKTNPPKKRTVPAECPTPLAVVHESLDVKDSDSQIDPALTHLATRIAANINKVVAHQTDNVEETKEDAMATSLDAIFNDDTNNLQDIIDMTRHDPAFDALFNIFNVDKHQFIETEYIQPAKEKQSQLDDSTASADLNTPPSTPCEQETSLCDEAAVKKASVESMFSVQPVNIVGELRDDGQVIINDEPYKIGAAVPNSMLDRIVVLPSMVTPAIGEKTISPAKILPKSSFVSPAARAALCKVPGGSVRGKSRTKSVPIAQADPGKVKKKRRRGSMVTKTAKPAVCNLPYITIPNSTLNLAGASIITQQMSSPITISSNGSAFSQQMSLPFSIVSSSSSVNTTPVSISPIPTTTLTATTDSAPIAVTMAASSNTSVTEVNTTRTNITDQVASKGSTKTTSIGTAHILESIKTPQKSSQVKGDKKVKSRPKTVRGVKNILKSNLPLSTWSPGLKALLNITSPEKLRPDTGKTPEKLSTVDVTSLGLLHSSATNGSITHSKSNDGLDQPAKTASKIVKSRKTKNPKKKQTDKGKDSGLVLANTATRTTSPQSLKIVGDFVKQKSGYCNVAQVEERTAGESRNDSREHVRSLTFDEKESATSYNIFTEIEKLRKGNIEFGEQNEDDAVKTDSLSKTQTQTVVSRTETNRKVDILDFPLKSPVLELSTKSPKTPSVDSETLLVDGSVKKVVYFDNSPYTTEIILSTGGGSGQEGQRDERAKRDSSGGNRKLEFESMKTGSDMENVKTGSDKENLSDDMVLVMLTDDGQVEIVDPKLQSNQNQTLFATAESSSCANSKTVVSTKISRDGKNKEMHHRSSTSKQKSKDISSKITEMNVPSTSKQKSRDISSKNKEMDGQSSSKHKSKASSHRTSKTSSNIRNIDSNSSVNGAAFNSPEIGRTRTQSVPIDPFSPRTEVAEVLVSLSTSMDSITDKTQCNQTPRKRPRSDEDGHKFKSPYRKRKREHGEQGDKALRKIKKKSKKKLAKMDIDKFLSQVHD